MGGMGGIGFTAFFLLLHSNHHSQSQTGNNCQGGDDSIPFLHGLCPFWLCSVRTRRAYYYNIT